MRVGRRWIALDADFFANHFVDRLLERFGPAGVCLFVAFLCACKKGRVQGQITYASDVEALQLLGIQNLPLVDDSGDKWTLDDFWKFTGTQKQTRKTCHGRVKNVKATRWGRWQDSFKRQNEAERKRRSRRENSADKFWTAPGHDPGHVADTKRTDIDSDIDSDTPLPPKGADASQQQNGNNRVNPVTQYKAKQRGHR